MMRPIAQLPMYDFPEVREATAALWAAIASRLRSLGLSEVPDSLANGTTHHQSWRHPRLLIGQSCGYPALTTFRAHLRIIARPVYAAPGCIGDTHCSFILVGATSPAEALADLRGSRFALNSRDSNTGMNLPRLAFAPLAAGRRFFSAIIETGSHAESLVRVAAGTADAAAVDCVSYALLARHRPALAVATRILARTASSPTLPFVTARGTDGAADPILRLSLVEALADPALQWVRDALFLAAAIPASEADYHILLQYRDAARQIGYPRLA
ncbi:MAG TPA: PhnD/SsuA/transferrin family substrate-binding protein [Stellaceae bacterium]|nr:PhnD/SsuA/transferrin family substrate-binding protein [Stellaceae bacterium]